MHRVSDDSSLFILDSDQGVDTFVQHALGQTILARLLSFRCQEAQSQALPCQDYARVLSKQQGSSMSFCVCDGVGSSYKGNFAAHYLATRLVDWLQTWSMLPHKASRLLRSLHPRLDQWAREAQETLACFETPPDVPALVREVLEELRTTHGSETVFFCGRIDTIASLPLQNTKERSLFARPKRPRFNAFFFWMGNVSARLYLPDQPFLELSDSQNDSNRWSTVHGRRGSVAFQTLTFDSIDRLLIYTDGLAAIGDTLADLNDDALQEQARTLLLSPTSDDMTVLDIQWLHATSTKEELS